MAEKTVCECGGQFDTFAEYRRHVTATPAAEYRFHCVEEADAAPDVPGRSRVHDAAGYYPTDWQEVAGEFEAAYVSTSEVVSRARVLGDRLRASTDHRVQECGAFIGEALDGTLDEAALAAFLRGRP